MRSRSTTPLRARLDDVAALLANARDLVDDRPALADAAAPAGAVAGGGAVAARGWCDALLRLDDETLGQLESGGLAVPWPASLPQTLLSFVDALRDACALPLLARAGSATSTAQPVPADARGQTPRKRAQIEALVALLAPLAASSNRVVDVGAGHGHLTREIAARVDVPVLGIERDLVLAARASSSSTGDVSFAVSDVLHDGLALADRDCVCGLHACGELGDAVVDAAVRAAERRAFVRVVFVGCCLQKQRAAVRRPLCAFDDDATLAACSLPKDVLGLSNVTLRDVGVEASSDENQRARERRLVLRRLLAQQGLLDGPGTEIKGLNRRAAHGDVDVLVQQAFAVRGAPAPRAPAIAAAQRWARERHAAVRRLSLPRDLLGRLIEVFVVLDRAARLEAHGFDVDVGVAFHDDVSARNLALRATPR